MSTGGSPRITVGRCCLAEHSSGSLLGRQGPGLTEVTWSRTCRVPWHRAEHTHTHQDRLQLSLAPIESNFSHCFPGQIASRNWWWVWAFLWKAASAKDAFASGKNTSCWLHPVCETAISTATSNERGSGIYLGVESTIEALLKCYFQMCYWKQSSKHWEKKSHWKAVLSPVTYWGVCPPLAAHLPAPGAVSSKLWCDTDP